MQFVGELGVDLAPALEEAGLVSRRNWGTVPPKVDYSLTQDGEALLPTLNELYRWGEAHMRTSGK